MARRRRKLITEREAMDVPNHVVRRAGDSGYDAGKDTRIQGTHGDQAMTSETIEVVFRYTVEYETELGRAQAIRTALTGGGGIISGQGLASGPYSVEREHVGRIFGGSKEL